MPLDFCTARAAWIEKKSYHRYQIFRIGKETLEPSGDINSLNSSSFNFKLKLFILNIYWKKITAYTYSFHIMKIIFQSVCETLQHILRFRCLSRARFLATKTNKAREFSGWSSRYIEGRFWRRLQGSAAIILSPLIANNLNSYDVMQHLVFFITNK